MQNWINKIFKSKRPTEKKSIKTGRQIDFVQISTSWNADPVSPEVELQVVGNDLEMDIYLNHYAYENTKEGDKTKIKFKNCSEYSLNVCNDEGYYYGQYRTTPKVLSWGEFYEIKGGLDRNLPQPIVQLTSDKSHKRHFVFFFKDEAFECLASDFSMEFYNEKSK